MSTITVKKTITEHHPEKRYNKETDKWEARCQHETPCGKVVARISGRGTRFAKDWHEVEPPKTVPYAERYEAGITGGGTIRRDITIEGDWSGDLNNEQVDIIVRSLISNYHFSSPDLVGLSNEARHAAIRHQMNIERLLIMFGATTESMRELD